MVYNVSLAALIPGNPGKQPADTKFMGFIGAIHEIISTVTETTHNVKALEEKLRTTIASQNKFFILLLCFYGFICRLMISVHESSGKYSFEIRN